MGGGAARARPITPATSVQVRMGDEWSAGGNFGRRPGGKVNGRWPMRAAAVECPGDRRGFARHRAVLCTDRLSRHRTREGDVPRSRGIESRGPSRNKGCQRSRFRDPSFDVRHTRSLCKAIARPTLGRGDCLGKTNTLRAAGGAEAATIVMIQRS
jgi:hypothetical protein